MLKPMQHRMLAAAASIAAAAAFFAPSVAMAAPNPGDLVRTPGNPSVYYYGADFKRYVFPNQKTYNTWYANFDGVKVITNDEMGALPIGGNVTYKPTARMVKITTDPTVYVVSKGGILRAVASEALAKELYGNDWNRQIDDVPDPFFVNYQVGAPLTKAGDYNKSALTNGDPSINVDKRLVPPPYGYVDVLQNAGFTPNAITIKKGEALTWIAMDSSMPTVASDPHPTHTDIPNFQTTTVPMGQTWSYTFNQTGTFGYHNHNFPDQTGTVTVTE